MKCRMFLTTLAGPVQQWFTQLPVESISFFNDFQEVFLNQYARAKRPSKSSFCLMTIKKEPNKTLREYLKRFNDVALKMPKLEPETKTMIFVNGLRSGIFFDSSVKEEPKSFDDLPARARSYIHAKDARIPKMQAEAALAKKIRKKKKKMSLKAKDGKARRKGLLDLLPPHSATFRIVGNRSAEAQSLSTCKS